MSQPTRRKLLSGAAASLAAGTTASAQSGSPVKKVLRIGPKPATAPAYSPGIQYGSLIFISGVIFREPGDIKVATEGALADIKKQLEAAGSSLNKVLKCTVFLADMKDFAGMNEVYLGKFGDEPPARTTVGAAGLPANSLVEIDVIAFA